MVNWFKYGKAPGICGIHAELLKAGGNAKIVSLHTVLCSAWNTGIIQTDWKRGLVVLLWKGKSDRQDCNNYREMTLLSVPSNVFAQIMLDGVRHHLLEHQPPEQSGFTPKKSMIDLIVVLGSSPNADESFGRGCLQPLLISVKRLIQ